jgi:hypothetical protein
MGLKCSLIEALNLNTLKFQLGFFLIFLWFVLMVVFVLLELGCRVLPIFAYLHLLCVPLNGYLFHACKKNKYSEQD